MAVFRISAVLFDLDGTLLDDVPLHVDAWEEGFKAFGFRLSREAVHSQIGKGATPLIAALIGDADPTVSEKIRERHDRAFRDLLEEIAPFPKAGDLLRALRARGIKTALVTSSQSGWVKMLVEKFAFDFDALVTSSDVEATKPDPAPFLCALGKLEIEASEAVAVGDSPFDALGARKAGLRCIGVLSGGFRAKELKKAGANAIARDVAEIFSKLEKSDSLLVSSATML